MIALVAALSASVVLGLAAAGYPPLTANVDGSPGGILLGDQHQFEHWSPPRIIFTPTKSTFGARDTTRGVATVAANAPYSAESLRLLARRVFASELLTFEVRCWGIAPVSAPDLDYAFTQGLYHQVLASAQELCVGCYEVDGGTWTDATHVVRAGREFVFAITFNVPILTTLAPLTGQQGLPFAPAAVAPDITDTMVLSTGGSGPGCEVP
jgi:hypothetical protein